MSLLTSTYLALLLTLLQLQNLFSGSLKLVALWHIPFMLMVASYGILKSASIRWSSNSFLLYFFLLVIAHARGLFGGIKIQWVAYSLLVILSVILLLFFVQAAGGRHKIRFLKAILLSPVIYVSVNFFLYVIGLKNSWSDGLLEDYGSGSAVMLGYLGVEVERVHFFLANGINSFAVPAGFAVVIGICGYKDGFLSKPISVLVVGIAGAAVLLVDSRAVIAGILMSFFVFMFLAGSKIYIYRVLVVLIPLYPFFVIFVMVLLHNLGMDFVFRGDSDAETLNSRGYIWEAALSKLYSFDVWHIFGYGINGQHASGLSDAISSVLVNRADSNSVTLHNSFIQNVFDIGYFGLVVILLVVFRYFDVVSSSVFPDEYRTVCSVLMLYVLFLSGTEVVFSVYFESFVFVFMLLGYVCLVQGQGNKVKS